MSGYATWKKFRQVYHPHPLLVGGQGLPRANLNPLTLILSVKGSFLVCGWFSHLVPIVATSAKERHCSLGDQIRHPAVVKEMTHILTPRELSPTGSFLSIKECFNDIQTRLWMMVLLRVIEITPVPCAVAFHGIHSTCHGIKNKEWRGSLLR